MAVYWFLELDGDWEGVAGLAGTRWENGWMGGVLTMERTVVVGFFRVL